MKEIHAETKKLYDNIVKHSNTEIAQKIAFELDLPSSPTTAERAAWVKHISAAMEQEFDEQTIKNIRSGCYCGENGHLDESKRLIRNIYDASTSLEDFVHKMNDRKAGWYLHDGYVFTKYLSCPCPMLDGIDNLATKTWCYCTVGYNKVIFEHVFNCEVDVEVLESIKMGDEKCLMKIVPKNGT